MALLALGAGCAGGEPAEPAPPGLDRLAPTLLGREGRPEAYDIVFVGDGFRASELPRYRRRVDALVAGLRESERGFVPRDRELYRFHRVDAVSAGDDVDGEVRDDTALGAHLDPDSDSCDGLFIRSDRERVERAVGGVPEPDAIVVIADRSRGRANADGARVHLSSRHSWRVLEHELGHALFGLGDEYSEFLWCSERTEDGFELLPTPNVTTELSDPAKWGALVEGVEIGAGRWPCHGRPTSSCVMRDAEAPRFCPVCAAAIREAVAARTCGSDRLPPRVHLGLAEVQDGAFLFEAAAYDVRGIASYSFLLDGEEIGRGAPWVLIDVSALAAGEHTLVARATDRSGLTGRSAARRIDVEHEPPTAEILTAWIGTDGWLRAQVRASPAGGELEIRAGGEVSTRSITSAPMEVSLPLRPPLDRTRELSAVARDRGGRASPPATFALEPQVLAADASRVSGAWIADVPANEVARVGPVTEVTLAVESCAPLDEVGFLGGDGSVLASEEVEPSLRCEHRIRLLLPAPEARASIRAYARDRFGRTGISDLDWAPEPFEPGPGDCVSAPALAGGSPELFGLTHPIEASLGVEAPPMSWSVTLDGRPAPAVEAEVEGAPGFLLAVGDPIVRPPVSEALELRATVVTGCAGELSAVTGVLAPVMDAVPPLLRVHRVAPEGGRLRLQVEDPSGIAAVEARWEDAVETDREPPFELRARGGALTLTARDRAGNVARVDRDVVLLPSPVSACAEGGG